ncbi:MAG: hypothetical protein U0893_00475 [Chloroflexota bacterium]
MTSKPSSPTEGERLSTSKAQSGQDPERPVDGITERTASVNPDSAPEGTVPVRSGGVARGGSEQGGMAGPVGQFEGEGNEGPLAPLGGDVTKSARDGKANSQGGVASGAPG